MLKKVVIESEKGFKMFGKVIRPGEPIVLNKNEIFKIMRLRGTAVYQLSKDGSERIKLDKNNYDTELIFPSDSVSKCSGYTTDQRDFDDPVEEVATEEIVEEVKEEVKEEIAPVEEVAAEEIVEAVAEEVKEETPAEEITTEEAPVETVEEAVSEEVKEEEVKEEEAPAEEASNDTPSEEEKEEEK